ncbi:MAG TPA: hypothetical protein VGQ41_10735 [Pyrinomonadaceae bacterium]|jgi:hypothetical protein|nr:hypothetical protein [Pyrinomonadaceae bacterium]
MSIKQSEAEFTKNLNTKFRINVDTPQPIELTLIDVTPRHIGPNEEPGMERFSAVFMGPREIFLPQQTYSVTHPDMGDFDIFLVALGQEPEGFKYEAVYNYYKED